MAIGKLPLLAIISLCCLAGVSISPLYAGAVPSTIQDEAKIFPGNLLSQMQARLVDSQQKSGVAIHVVTFASLHDDWDHRSQRVLQELTADDPAILLAFGWGMQTPVVKVSRSLGERYPVHEQSSLLAEALRIFQQPELPLSQKFDRATHDLAEGYSKLETARLAQESRHFPKELFFSLAAVVVGAALLMWIALLWLGRSSARHEEYYFPQVDVGSRLGAPFGGGVIVQTGTGAGTGTGASRRPEP